MKRNMNVIEFFTKTPGLIDFFIDEVKDFTER